MHYELAANLVLLLHLAFILFLVFGGFLVLRWRWMAWFHIPAAVWGALIEFAGWICPLTPLENHLREASGHAGYSGGFVEYYIVPIVYPTELTRETQMILGGLVVLVNMCAYALLLARCKRASRSPSSS